MEKTLYFEGAGCSGTKRNDVDNCRIRTRLQNNKGRLIYLELISCKPSKYSPKSIQKYTVAGFIDSCHYVDAKWDARRCSSEGLANVRHTRFEYTKANILNFVNNNLDCSFDNMEVVNNGLRVFDTEKALCSCCEGEFEPYQDIEINIDVLDGVKPIQQHKHFAQYKLNWETVKELDGLNRWIAEHTAREQADFANYRFYASLYFDGVTGIITSLEVSARQGRFCCMSFGAETLPHIIESIQRDNKVQEVAI